MALGHDLVPLKRVLEEVGVSRITLWRALNSGIDVPKPTIVRRRVFWRADEIQKIDLALDGFRGRPTFEAWRRQRLLISEMQTQIASQTPRRALRRRRKPREGQLELFGG